jgi:hypothetical protein
MEADYADDTGRQIPVDFGKTRSVLPFNLVKKIFGR